MRWWVVAMVVFFAQAAMAHKVVVFPYVEGDRVCVEAYFSDGSPAKGAEVRVYSSDGRLLLQGKTSEQGFFSFRPPERGDLKVVLIASMGHRAEAMVKAAELPAVQVEERPYEQVVDAAQLRAILREELRPVLEELHRQRARGFSLGEVVGGIGWIVGLAGLWMMLKGRRRHG